MNILMMSNTYTPHVGGVARSIEGFTQRFRELGHRVNVIAPEFENMPETEPDVFRIPAIRHFNKTDFSMAYPIPHDLSNLINDFKPDIVHSHHPFLIGGTALRIAHTYKLPLVFTHHTKYEDYTHNIPFDSPVVKRFVEKLATNYANVCDRVFVPSESMRQLVQQRGVTTPISVVPTGVDLKYMSSGNGKRFRQLLGIPDDAFVVGHLGRLTKEKNIPFLTHVVIEFLKRFEGDNTCFLLVGEGPYINNVKQQFKEAGLSAKLYSHGYLPKTQVRDAYHAMNLFAFASTSETQGMVLTEAMAASIPVVAVDASGVREVVRDQQNGRLLSHMISGQYVEALMQMVNLSDSQFKEFCKNAYNTASEFSMDSTADKAIHHYNELIINNTYDHQDVTTLPENIIAVFEAEWQLLKNTLAAITDSVVEQLD